MKTTKTLLLTCLISFIGIHQANSQFSVGPQFGYSYGIGGINNYALGVRGDYILDDKYGIAGSFGFHLPKTFESSTYVNAFSSSHSQRSVSATEKYLGFKLLANGKYYFANTEYESNFGLYWIFGAGLSYYRLTKTITGKYDKDTHYPSNDYENDIYKESFIDFTMNGGIGAEFMIANNYLFTEFKLLIPATQANGQAIEVEIPVFFHLTAGYKFSLD